jgi:hypothetical protein
MTDTPADAARPAPQPARALSLWRVTIHRHSTDRDSSITWMDIPDVKANAVPYDEAVALFEKLGGSGGGHRLDNDGGTKYWHFYTFMSKTVHTHSICLEPAA